MARTRSMDEEHGCQRVALEHCKPGIRNKNRYKAGNDQSDDKPLAYVLHHLYKGIAEGRLHFFV